MPKPFFPSGVVQSPDLTTQNRNPRTFSPPVDTGRESGAVGYPCAQDFET